MKHKKRTSKNSLLQLLAPFLVDHWAARRDRMLPGTYSLRLMMLWDALDREEARRDGRDDTCI